VPAAVAEVIAGTAENRSSMLQDVEAGRSTEIEYITGFLVGEGARLGVTTPLNSTLLDEVRSLAA
jgi:2-dehydropantoate 2-reductase